jgi:hypothetical protein
MGRVGFERGTEGVLVMLHEGFQGGRDGIGRGREGLRKWWYSHT